MTGGRIGKGRWIHYFAFWDAEKKWAVSLCQKWTGEARESSSERDCSECCEESQMGDNVTTQDWVLNPETKALLESRFDSCFLCKWIVEDFLKHGKLTGWPKNEMCGDQFPITGKLAHIRLEKRSAKQEKKS